MEPKSPAVACSDCGRTWNSQSMVEGLRLLGACPRCGGHLDFAEDDAVTPLHALEPEDASVVAPHLVLGIPRHR